MDAVICVEGEKSFFLASRAEVLDFPPTGDRELAWAEKHIFANPALKYVLGRYVEADKANHNKQFWALDQLQMARPTIAHGPVNLLHQPRHVIGSIIDTEMMYPIDNAADGTTNPYIEALGVLWKVYFPQEVALVESAHSMGQLFWSMECTGESLTCGGESGCGETFAYAGPRSTTYCAHLNKGESIKQINNPHFLAGAMIIPPEKPGWSGARISDISQLVEEHKIEAEVAYQGFRAAAPELVSSQWEYLMNALMAQAKGTEEAKKKMHHKPGTSVHLTQQVGHFPPGTNGVVTQGYNGPYYGVAMGGGPTYYCPEPAMEPNVTPPNEVSPGVYASLSPAVKAQVDEIAEQARQFNADQRKKAADTGAAMPDGSFPIQNLSDLNNAIQAWGRANPSKRSSVKAHIMRRAKALGASDAVMERISSLGSGSD